MRLGRGVEWGLHAATMLALLPEGGVLTAGQLAEFHGVPTGYLAKVMQSMARGGLVEATTGRHGGYRLSRDSRTISLLAVVEAIEGPGPSFHCTEIRKRGPARVPDHLYPPICAIAAAMGDADQAWRDRLSVTTIADLVDRVTATMPEESATKSLEWFIDALGRAQGG